MSKQKSKPLRLVEILAGRQFMFSVVLVIAAVLLNAAASWFIEARFPDRPQVPDLLFQLLPYIPSTQYLTDIFDVLSPMLVLCYYLAINVAEIPFAVSVYAITEIFRSFIVVLTPLGGPLGNMATYGLTKIHQHGQFPSGHTLEVAIGYMLVDGAKAPALKFVLLLLVMGEIASLLLSHGHYSIDIVGGLLIAYFSKHELDKYKSLFLPLPN